jgi:hypothetical protein
MAAASFVKPLFPVSGRRPDMRQSLASKIRMGFWIGSTAAIIGIGMYYIPREYHDQGFWKTLYFTLRLFVFEHDFPSFPISAPVIFIHFAAPAVTISALWTAIAYLLSLSPAVKTRWMHDHVILCGLGRTGKIFARALRENGVPAVGIDLNRSEALGEWSGQNNLIMLYGDFHSRHLLEKAGVQKARAVIFASGNDIANLEGALGAYEWIKSGHGPVRLIWAQIADEQLADTVRCFMRTSGKIGIRIFDTYRIAAARMIAKYCGRKVRRQIEEINILGFGKFGHDLLSVFLNELQKDEIGRIRVIDRQDLERSVMAHAEEFGWQNKITFQQSDIKELDYNYHDHNAYFICTDDDLGNLTATMLLAQKAAVSHIYVRVAHWPLPAVSEHLGEARGIYFVNINNLVLQGIKDLPGIFAPAKEVDLKRHDDESVKDASLVCKEKF